MNVDQAKMIAMVSLGVGSFIAGILPVWLSPVTRQRCPLFLSCLLCWGGGVLLATALLHMLPEARETLPEYSELTVCGGFFLIYFVDELVHFLCGERINSRQNDNSNRNTEGSFLINHQGHSHQRDRGHSHQSNRHHSHQSERVHSHYGACADHGRGERPEDTLNSCHVSHDEPCLQSAAGSIGLLVALLLHSVLEGLAIGLQSITSKVLLLAGAVASHKLVVGFCLGVELSVTRRGKICSHIVAISIFSLGSVIGIGAGMFIEESNSFWTESTLGVLQSLAAGTLLYVTVSEVLPRERAKWHHSKRYAGLVQLMATIFGFVLMFLLSAYLDE